LKQFFCSPPDCGSQPTGREEQEGEYPPYDSLEKKENGYAGACPCSHSISVPGHTRGTSIQPGPSLL